MRDFSINELAHIIKVTIQDSGLKAVLSIDSTDELDVSISENDFKEFLNSKKIVYGLNEDVLKSFCTTPSAYIGKSIEIAKGYEPVNGEDGYIVWEVEKREKNELTVLENGNVDYRNLDNIINIKKEQLIASKVLSTKAVPGMSVSGTEIKGKNGKEYSFKIGKNVKFNDEKDKIYANVEGQLVLTENNKINIFPLYEVRGDLGFDIGNIDFVGTVIIKGNVPDGFIINAAGEIKIYGNVEGAELRAGGNIFIQHGIIGHNKSFIESKKSLTVSYILDANVRVEEDVNVIKSIMHSKVSAGSKINCVNGKGIIVGGTVQAGDSVIANVIGNDLNTVTSIEVGINPLIREEMNNIKKEKKSLEESMGKINNGLLLFEKMKKTDGNLPQKKIELNSKFIKQKFIINKRLFEIDLRKKDIEEEMDRINNSFIMVKDKIFSGSKLVIGDGVKFIKEEIKFAKFVLEDDIIKTIK